MKIRMRKQVVYPSGVIATHFRTTTLIAIRSSINLTLHSLFPPVKIQISEIVTVTVTAVVVAAVTALTVTIRAAAIFMTVKTAAAVFIEKLIVVAAARRITCYNQAYLTSADQGTVPK